MLEGIEIKESFATTWFKIARVIKRLRFMRFLMRGNGVCVCVCVCVRMFILFWYFLPSFMANIFIVIDY